MQKKSKEQKIFDKALGLYVKKKRLKMGWTQAELASRIGNNAQNISSIERGEVTPTLFWFVKLAEAFEIKFTLLLKDFKFDSQK